MKTTADTKTEMYHYPYNTIRIELGVFARLGYEDQVYMDGSLEIFINQPPH